MSYKNEKDINGIPNLVIDGFENGIASSPHKGIANIQGGNISTEMGEVMSSFGRTRQSQVAGVTGTLTPTSNTTISVVTAGGTLLPGSWIHITADSGTGLTGDYYYLGGGKLSTQYANDTSYQVTGIQTGPAQTTIFLTSGTSWVVPADWNSTFNSIEVIGAGGAGGGGTAGNHGAGGGGGAYSKVSNLTLTPSASITYAIGAAGTGILGATGNSGGDTYFNGASLGASSVGAKGGSGGSTTPTGTPVTGALGGQSSAGVGTTKYSGGNGGDATDSAPVTNGAGGGGAAGLHGVGGNGVVSTGSQNGGQGDVTFGGTGGTGNPTGFGGAGNPGTEYDGSHGSGGGGGGGGNSAGAGFNGGDAGLYGGGGGGGGSGTNSFGGAGTQGLIVIRYTPLLPITTSATFTVYSMVKPVQSTTEPYMDTAGQQYRYYILDEGGQIWMHDTVTLISVSTPDWAMITVPATITQTASGLAVLNGWLVYAIGNNLYWASTVKLGTFTSVQPTIQLSTKLFHAALVGHQGKLYETDGTFLASMFPNTSLLTGTANIQSYCSYTAATTLGSVTALIGGSLPSSTVRIPVFFITNGTLPASITAGTIYWVKWLGSSDNKYFEVYDASSGGSAKDIQTGAVGTQYFNTFYPISTDGQTTLTYTQQKLNLPFYETSQSIIEIGNTVLVGCKSNTIYQWNQISVTPQDFIVLPENNVVNMISVNNMGYAFAGQKGNVYITNGSSVSPALKVPDYCAGVPGTPNSYIEPYFTWGGAMYLRGRVYFSIQDQTSTKAGNCGGIWSFVPSQNYSSQDVGLSIRLENQSSYGSYNGAASVLLPSQIQTNTNGPQYWSGWYSSVSAPTYGIDFSDTIPTTATIIETELIPTGTLLGKKTFEQIEYKLATPLANGESITIKYRQNGTAAWSSLGTVKTESATALSGYFTVNFQNGQWLQLQVTLNPLASTSSSFCRLYEIRLR